MQDKIEKFIVLGNKAKVLLKIENDLEPRVNVLINSKGNIVYTFNSSCFPFFSENEFETVDEKDVDLFLEKCELFVKNLEKNAKVEFEKEQPEVPAIKQTFKHRYRPNFTRSAFLIKTKDRKVRIYTQVCKEHEKNITNGVWAGEEPCHKRKIFVEELEN